MTTRDTAQLLHDLFDTDDSDDETESASGKGTRESQPWAKVTAPQQHECQVAGVPGLSLVKSWLDNDLQPLENFNALAQAHLFHAVQGSGALSGTTNQAMFFGTNHMPAWAIPLLAAFPTHLLGEVLGPRLPLFDQMILNKYDPGDGIVDHVDLARFQDGIAVVSLGGTVIMNFTPVPESDQVTVATQGYHRAISDTAGPPVKRDVVQVPLEGGDLLVLTGEARYKWMHGIRHVAQEVHEATGTLITRTLRISITLRRLCEDQILTEPAAD